MIHWSPNWVSSQDAKYIESTIVALFVFRFSANWFQDFCFTVFSCCLKFCTQFSMGSCFGFRETDFFYWHTSWWIAVRNWRTRWTCFHENNLSGNLIFFVPYFPPQDTWHKQNFLFFSPGDQSGKIVIWNMAPVRDEEKEKDPNVPKMLCQMDNHLGKAQNLKIRTKVSPLLSAVNSMHSIYELFQAIFCHSRNVFAACVNCVRWSKSGRFLASAGDDKLVMIWQSSK